MVSLPPHAPAPDDPTLTSLQRAGLSDTQRAVGWDHLGQDARGLPDVAPVGASRSQHQSCPGEGGLRSPANNRPQLSCGGPTARLCIPAHRIMLMGQMVRGAALEGLSLVFPKSTLKCLFH